MSMAYEANLVNQAFVAGQDLQDYQYYPVKMNSSEEILLASDAGDTILGVLQNDPDDEEAATVAFAGITKAIGGAVIAAGALVSTESGGKFITQTTGTAAGMALTGCGADEETFSLLIFRQEYDS